MRRIGPFTAPYTDKVCGNRKMRKRMSHQLTRREAHRRFKLNRRVDVFVQRFKLIEIAAMHRGIVISVPFFLDSNETSQ